jgi:hypothetical protein
MDHDFNMYRTVVDKIKAKNKATAIDTFCNKYGIAIDDIFPNTEVVSND